MTDKIDTIPSPEALIRAALPDSPPAPAAIPFWVSNCMICGRIVDTREPKDGGDPHGCEYDAGWVCSPECADALLDAPAPAGVTVDVPPAVIGYTNWRGETSSRSIIPHSVWYGSTEWHPNPQWFIRAFDTDKQATRDFALADIGEPAGVRVKPLVSTATPAA